MVWGSVRSCNSLLDLVDRNELEELVILSTRSVTGADWNRLIEIIVTKHGNSRKLKSLQASGHKMDGTTLKALGQAINQSSQNVPWTLVALGNKELGCEGGLEQFLSGLNQPNNTVSLASLDLSYKGLTRTNLNAILRLTRSCKHLKQLDLSRNDGLFQDLRGDKRIDQPLFPFVKCLDVSSTEMDGQAARSLLESLSTSGSCCSLNLSNNPMSSPTFDVVGTCTCIRILNLSRCNIGDDSLALLGTDANKLSGLENLDLSHNYISEVSMDSFSKWLSNCAPHLSSLNLAGNIITQTGIENLILNGLAPRGMERRLGFLDLSETQCGIHGASVAVESSNVVSLRLFNNQLGSHGFHALAPQLVGGHETLETLDLAANGAEEDAVVSLLQGFLSVLEADKSKLTTLVVGGNGGGQDLEEVIAAIRSVRPAVDIARDKLRKN